MPVKTFRFSGFSGGLYAPANLFDQPRGTVMRCSNMVYTKRGGFQTVDGTHQVITPTGGGPYAPWSAFIRHNQIGVSLPTVTQNVGITLQGGTATIYVMPGPTWAPPALGSFANAGPTVGMVQIGGSLAFALGLNVPPQIYNTVHGLAQIANTFQPNTSYPPWLYNTVYPKGSKIIVPIGASSYVFLAKHGGTSGAAPGPNWGAAPHVGDEIGDGSVVWQDKGVVGAAAPIGAAFVFNHYSALWIWGTASTYLTNGIHGPDGLAMSAIGLAGGVQPTSFDPADTEFIGQGDGQSPMGGHVFSELEVGIPATAQLVLFKSKDTYAVLGAFPDIAVAQIPFGAGCAAPNTIQAVIGIGLMRLASEGVAVFNGTRDVVDQFTDPIRPYLFPDSENSDIVTVDWTNIQLASSTVTSNPPGYLMLVPLLGSGGVLTRGFFFDRLLKAWTVIDFPASLQLSMGYFDYAYGGPSLTVLGGYADGIIRVGFAGDEFWDTAPNVPVLWNLRVPTVGAPTSPQYLRRGLLQARDLTGVTNPTAAERSVLMAANLRTTDMNGLYSGGQSKLLEPDATQLSQSVDLDLTVMGGATVHFYGQGRVIAHGLAVQYEPKADTRVPVFV